MRTILLSLALLCASISQGQPFNLQFGHSGDDMIYKVIAADTNHFFLIGSVYENDGHQIWLMKIDSAGNQLWEKSYGFNDKDDWEVGYTLRILNDGNMIIAGDAGDREYFDDRVAILIKVDHEGNQIWKQYYEDIEGLQDILPDPSGFVAVGFNNRKGVILHVDSMGNELIKSDFKISDETVIDKILPASDHQFILVGRSNRIGAGYEGGYIARVTAEDDLLWYRIFDTQNSEYQFKNITEWFRPPMGVYQDSNSLIWICDSYKSQIGLFVFDTTGNEVERKIYGQTRKDEWPTSLIPTKDGGWLMTGVFEQDSSFAIKLNATGKQEWLTYYGRGNHNAYTLSVAESNDHYLLSGLISDHHGASPSNGLLLGIEKNGNPFPFTVHLSLHYDIAGDCLYTADDLPLSGWFITASDSLHSTKLITDEQGKVTYTTDAFETRFDYVLQNSKHFDLCTTTSLIYTSPQDPVITERNVAHAKSDCAEIEVGLTQPDLVQCDTSTFWITLVNRGVKLSNETILRFEYDTTITLIAFSGDYTVVPEGVLVNIPPIDPVGGEYRIFGRIVLSCLPQLGAAHRMRAVLLSPNCEPVYNGPQYAIASECAGDKIRFLLSNEGEGGALATTSYNLFVNDFLLIHEQPIILPEGGNKIIFEYPADGRTWRMELFPDITAPNQRKNVTTVEGCGRLNTGLYNVGFTNGFSSGPADIKSSETYAMNSVGLPNAITESMPGIFEKNSITRLEPLEFTAHAKNNTGHIVDEVVFDLNFERGLDMTTFHILSSNNKVTCVLSGNTTIRATMKNLFLSEGDEAMIRFRVEPDDSLKASQYGTIIRVQGNAFFDGEGPVSLMDGDYQYNFDNPELYNGYADYPPDMLVYTARGDDFATGMARNKDGDLFIVGSSDSYSENYLHYGLVIKANSGGKVIWQKMIVIEGTEINIHGAVPTNDGGCFVYGDLYYLKDPEGYIDFYYGLSARLDAEGHVLWHKIMRPVNDLAGTYFHNGFMSTDSSVILYGIVRYEGDHTIVLKMDLNGNIIWQFYQPRGETSSLVEGINLKNGGYSFLGPTIFTLDAEGKFKSKKSFSFTGGSLGNSFTSTPDGGYLVMGYGEKDTLSSSVVIPKFIKTDSSGVELWEKHLWFGEGINVEGYTIIPAQGGGYLFGGVIHNHTPGHDDDMLLGKIDEEANLEWFRYFGNKNDERLFSIVNDVPDEIRMLGLVQVRSRFDKIQILLVKSNGEGVSAVKPIFEEEKRHVLLFPNPVEDILNIVLTPAPDEMINWVICDLSGKHVFEGSVNALDPFQIPMDALAAGMYLIAFPGSHFQASKFIVLR